MPLVKKIFYAQSTFRFLEGLFDKSWKQKETSLLLRYNWKESQRRKKV